jgi:peptide/nickel transport system permease protein
VLPVIALAVGPVAIVIKQTRDEMQRALESEYIRTLRASGLSERSVVIKHALKNAAVPVLTVLGVICVQLLSGTVIVETVFALPGLGSLGVTAVSAHDLPVIEGVVVYFTLIVIAVNLLVDIAYGWLNPKVRVG